MNTKNEIDQLRDQEHRNEGAKPSDRNTPLEGPTASQHTPGHKATTTAILHASNATKIASRTKTIDYNYNCPYK